MASQIPHNVLFAMHARTRGEVNDIPGWLLFKQTPKEPTWGRSRHGAARVTHRIRYVLEAVEQSKKFDLNPVPIQRGLRSMTVTHYVMAVWWCGAKAHDWRGIDLMPNPIKARRPLAERCHKCEDPRIP